MMQSQGALLQTRAVTARPLLLTTAHRYPIYSPAASSRTRQLLLSSAQAKEVVIRPPAPPTTLSLLKFALPALALWLSSPLLSLVDTSVIGLSATVGRGASQLAALGPATTFCDGSVYLFAFLNVATTNLYASAKVLEDKAPAGSKGNNRSGSTEAVVRRAAKVALTFGTLLVPLLLAFAKPLLSLYVGPAAAAQSALIGPATTYVLIRALSMPAALLSGVLTAALLGAKDSLTPLLATAAATGVNVALDLLAVSRFKLGLAGDAAATTAAQWVGALLLVHRAQTRLLGAEGLALAPAWIRRRQQQAAGKSAADAARSVPTAQFLKFAAPVLVLILGKIAAYGLLTHAAAALGEVPLAAHQIVLSVFFFLTPFLEVISQTGQAYLPGYEPPAKQPDADADAAEAPAASPPSTDAMTEEEAKAKWLASLENEPSWKAKNAAAAEPTSEWRTASDALAGRLLRYAVRISTGCALAGAAVALYGTPLLTNDLAVRQAVRPLALPLAVSAFLCGPIGAAEGVLLARRQLKFLAGTYLVSVALLPRLLFAVRTSPSGSVRLVWECFALFQLVRATAFGARVWGPALFRRARASLQPRTSS